MRPSTTQSLFSAFLLVLVCLAEGCGTTRMTDTQRTATEQLLVSNAIDQAVSELNFESLAGKTVYLDPQYLDSTVDRGYLVSSLRQELLSSGALILEDRAKATYIVEPRSGGVGTDRHGVLLGIPQMNVPTFLPGQPSQIPEIPLAKKTDQEGIAKIAVFAYNRETGQPLWQSGLVQAHSTAKDTWVFGAGPFQRGSIHTGTRFAGEQLSPFKDKDSKNNGSVLSSSPVTWAETNLGKTDSKRLAILLGAIPLSERPKVGETKHSEDQGPGPTMASTAKVPSGVSSVVSSKGPSFTSTANGGGQAESEPSKVVESGSGFKAGTQGESEPSKVTETNMASKPDS